MMGKRVLDAFEQKIVDVVDSHGWFVLSVAPAAGSDDPQEWWSYTIGLPKTFSWPELICFGLATDVRVRMLNNAVEELRERRIAPEAGLELDGVLNNYPVRFIDAVIPDSYLGSAAWYARYTGALVPPKYLQLTWPDDQGRFPNDPTCAADVRADQIPLESE
ncbi:DUF4262 domain-containing protein [Enterovirga sp. GCM10030262]|uniref:DUF4262 domain-containing protein n=1 Tax=Enterovirga sp. GCM10030262 TaxID=3273391 RepID=UPI0036083C93